ncbi:MAG: leucyl aminopeptidase family protein [Nannocystaceae bacterium]|nr:leucyl aminopeptidase family protein [Nannocystaceae bacterium]
MHHFAPRPTATTTPVSALTKKEYRAWRKKQAKATLVWLDATGFAPDIGKVALLPARNGSIARVVLGLGESPNLWSFAGLAAALPSKGRYAYDKLPVAHANDAALAWALSTYQFTRYKKPSRKFATLVWPDGADLGRVTRLAQGIELGRDLINTPAEDLGPAELVEAVKTLGAQHNAKVTVIKGDALLKNNYPTVHAVGRAATRVPQLADLRWGAPGDPKVTLVGKGVCFDSGGLDLKSAAGMKLMKKDMGGAATALALAHAIMDAGLAVRLRVLIPTVENAVAGNAYRPGDVLTTRKGLTVEIGNTDAEGRLILCDALCEADSEEPEVLIDFATLTGAARVALGTELPALFSNDDELAQEILTAGLAEDDAVWRMPLHAPYNRHLDSKIADLNNIANIGQGGAITAALFLQRFVSSKRSWAHLDTMGWNTGSRPGRPAGGDVFGVRAVYAALEQRYPAAAQKTDEA